MAKKASPYDKADKNLQRISKTVGAIVVLISATTGLATWISDQFANAVSNQINEFKQEMIDANIKHEQSITRVELIELIEHDPENIAAIEKIAKYYFQDLNGDLYMTKKYSDWAHKYGGDPTIVVIGSGK